MKFPFVFIKVVYIFHYRGCFGFASGVALIDYKCDSTSRGQKVANFLQCRDGCCRFCDDIFVVVGKIPKVEHGGFDGCVEVFVDI